MYIKKILLSLVLLGCFTQIVSASGRTLSEVADIMDVSEYEAKQILNATSVFIKDVEGLFSMIADSKYDYRSKVGAYGLIDNTIELFQYGKNSIIETSSLHRSRINKRQVNNYLHSLARMSRKSNNVSVKLEFGDEIHIDDIIRAGNNLTLNASVFQLFESCKDSGDGIKCYSDVTKKTFIVKIKKIGGEYRLLVNSLRVKDTMTVESYQNIKY